MDSDSDKGIDEREIEEQVASSHSQPSMVDRLREQYAIVHKRPRNNQLEQDTRSNVSIECVRVSAPVWCEHGGQLHEVHVGEWEMH